MWRCIIRYKDTNLKAIHNALPCLLFSHRVVLSDTKIQIWKQFTTLDTTLYVYVGCIIRYKDTNLKAIHNTHHLFLFFSWLYYPIQRYKFESNSQHMMQILVMAEVVLSDTKIQIWKQFTTCLPISSIVLTLYYPIQRYKFESNSQLWRRNCKTYFVVLSDTKIQIWKQFTTVIDLCILDGVLYYPIQRYKFESNSQHTVWT